MTKTVKKNVRWVKALHVLMTVIWPVFMIVLLIEESFLNLAYQGRYMFYYNPMGFVFLFLWFMYVFFMMLVIRNYNLQNIATQECDFSAYLECIKYLEKFQLPHVKRNQRVNRTDAYLLIGDFDAAYQNLMELKPQYERLNNRAKMMYDYFWCRFYGELEDMNNFRICMNVFESNWVRNPQAGRRLQRQAAVLSQELGFREMMFSGKEARIKADMMNLYQAGRLGSRYEFVRYCYYMGRLEYNMNNLEVAKHWFAQTVSFGLHEYMSSRAADFLAMLDYMQVPYAAAAPAHNQYYCNRRNFNALPCLISILIGLLVALAVMFYT